MGKSLMPLQKWKKEWSDWYVMSERRKQCAAEEPGHAMPLGFIFLILWEAIEAS